ncbi:uncharacterized protein K460DRAFT_372008 [Cucurbitaria berberidis CBS 394.84]|uniref:Uncharacterized protein n=1 Tax=Cucurbitaria berberidis CBS 394.84 TaxID=1168544 RepID=A0A9P4L370_9PLEO|nr:uncharacterized protein K460DRAFT_372008 [Cucurbitaria berberidis CBS 394.84]KAF1840035.1 hypothetical protein K460DRAFT_372008 [Cucurbitaria berberidis CBS 394.84]
MKRIKSALAPALLLISAVAAGAGRDLPNSNKGPRIEGKDGNLISGVGRAHADNVGVLNIPASEQVSGLDIGDIATKISQSKGLDVGSLLDEITQGQRNGQGKGVGSGAIKDNNIAADLANQIAGGGSPSIDQILNALNGQEQGRKNSGAAKGQGGTQGIEIGVGVLIGGNGKGHGGGRNQSQSARPIGTGNIAGDNAKSRTTAAGTSAPALEAKTTLPPAQGLNATLSSKHTKPAEAASASGVLPPSRGNQTDAVAISAGGERKQGANTTTSSSSVVAINSATLTPGGLAAKTTSAVGSAVTVQAGGNGTKTSSSSSTKASASGAAAAPVTISAGSGNGSNSSVAQAATKKSTHTVTVTVVVGVGNGSSNSTAARLSSTKAASVNTATRTKAMATPASSKGAAVTVIAGSGGSFKNGGCTCHCICPAGSFPMKAPQAPAFQLGPQLGSMAPSPGSTMQTVASAITVIPGSGIPIGTQQGITPPAAAASSVGATSATLASASASPSSSTAASQAASVIASSSTSILPEAPSASSASILPEASGASSTPPLPESSSASPTLASASTSVDVQSQVAASPTPTPLPGTSTTAAQQQNGLPFDINTIELHSRVTVGLGRRLARPTTAVKRGRRWW